MKHNLLTMALWGSTVLGSAAAADVTLTIESWRNDDLTLWQDKIIPVFEAANPGIKVKFTPSAPAEYNAVLNAKRAAGSAGDLITCRPFDTSLQLFEAGNLADLSDLGGMATFSDVAKSAWQTDDGSASFCVPMASVIHGFIYNKEAFDEVGVSVPQTEAARSFLDWMGTAEFAEIYANALPGFFSLSSHDIPMQDPLAQEFVSWRGECESTIRSTYQILSRGTPNLENDTWSASAQVIKGQRHRKMQRRACRLV